MRLACSGIAWDVTEDELISKLLQRYGVDAVDIVPGKYFPDPAAATDESIARVRNWWSDRGFDITGMQALLFGTTGLNVFGSIDSQHTMLKQLEAVCRIGAGLSATRIVFGSPKNRDRNGLNDQEAMDIAVPFFQRLGNIAQSFDVTICLEPNPQCYGANFMTTSTETAKVVQQVAHHAIKMQFDTGAITINNENPISVLQEYAHLIGHVHASEPDLLPLGDGETNHIMVAKALQQYLPRQLISIEMLATKNESHAVSIERALIVATQHYRTKEMKDNT